MLYGEGRKAFLRLQEEIVRTCPDVSIFAWKTSKNWNPEGSIASSVFASAAVDFAESSLFDALSTHSTNDFSISNQGIKLHTRLELVSIPKQQGYQYVFPVCKVEDKTILSIRLKKCGASQLVREDPSALVRHNLSFPSLYSRTMYFLLRLPPAASPKYLLRDIVLSTRSHILQIVLPRGMVVNNVWPWSRWDTEDQVFFVSDNLDLDYAAAKVSAILDVGKHGKSVDAHFDFMLYCLDWANTRSDKPLYTIVPWKPSDSILKDLNDKLDQYDYATSMVEEDLIAYKIPMSSTAKYESVDTGYSMIVTCNPHLECDMTKCHWAFWKLELSFQIEENEQSITLLPDLRESQLASHLPKALIADSPA